MYMQMYVLNIDFHQLSLETQAHNTVTMHKTVQPPPCPKLQSCTNLINYTIHNIHKMQCFSWNLQWVCALQWFVGAGKFWNCAVFVMVIVDVLRGFIFSVCFEWRSKSSKTQARLNNIIVFINITN